MINNIPKYFSGPNGYDIEGIGNYARVSNILAMGNFGNNILDKWKQGVRRNAFNTSLSSVDLSKATTNDIIDIWNTTYDAPDRYAKDSADFGSLLHEFLETLLTTGQEKKLPTHHYADPSICANSMLKFVKEWNLGPHTTIQAECLIWSDVYKYAGCIDYVAHTGGKIYIMDWKTTGSLHTKYLLQLAAYWVALEERAKDYGLDMPIEHVYLVRFDKTVPNYNVVDFGREQMLQYFEVFKSLLNIYNFNKSVQLG